MEDSSTMDIDGDSYYHHDQTGSAGSRKRSYSQYSAGQTNQIPPPSIHQLFEPDPQVVPSLLYGKRRQSVPQSNLVRFPAGPPIRGQTFTTLSKYTHPISRPSSSGSSTRSGRRLAAQQPSALSGSRQGKTYTFPPSQLITITEGAKALLRPSGSVHTHPPSSNNGFEANRGIRKPLQPGHRPSLRRLKIDRLNRGPLFGSPTQNADPTQAQPEMQAVEPVTSQNDTTEPPRRVEITFQGIGRVVAGVLSFLWSFITLSTQPVTVAAVTTPGGNKRRAVQVGDELLPASMPGEFPGLPHTPQYSSITPPDSRPASSDAEAEIQPKFAEKSQPADTTKTQPHKILPRPSQQPKKAVNNLERASRLHDCHHADRVDTKYRISKANHDQDTPKPSSLRTTIHRNNTKDTAKVNAALSTYKDSLMNDVNRPAAPPTRESRDELAGAASTFSNSCNDKDEEVAKGDNVDKADRPVQRTYLLPRTRDNLLAGSQTRHTPASHDHPAHTSNNSIRANGAGLQSNATLRAAFPSRPSRGLLAGTRTFREGGISSQDRDTAVEDLIRRARRATLETEDQKNVRRGFKHRKQREQEEAEEAERQKREAEEARVQREHEEEEARIKAKQAEEEAQAKAEKEAEEARVLAEQKAELARQQAEAEIARAHAPLIPDLTNEWNQRIQATMQKPLDKEITNNGTSVASIMLTRRDLGTILPQDGVKGDHDWLNDNTINAWFGALCMARSEQAGYHRNSKTPPPIAAFNSAWWMNVVKAGKGVEGIKTWSRRQGIKGEKLLHAEKIFFPINTGAHWTLLVISGRDRTIEHLDSLSTPASGKREISIARAWLAMELEERYLAEEWTELQSSSSRQPNSSDCGVYACFNGLAAVRGVGYGEVGSLRNKREKMAAVLINGGFSGLFGL